jgi:hypothetical protein
VMLLAPTRVAAPARHEDEASDAEPAPSS